MSAQKLAVEASTEPVSNIGIVLNPRPGKLA